MAISSTRRGPVQKLTKEIIKTVLSLHFCTNHPSPSVMARAIRDRAWTGIPPEITPAIVERVFAHQICYYCAIGKVHHWTPGPGSGAPWPSIGYAVSIDYVPVSKRAFGGFNAMFLIRELRVGLLIVHLTRDKTTFPSVVYKLRLYFLQYGLALRVIFTDSGGVEVSQKTRDMLNIHEIQIHPSPPEQQNQNPVERSVQTLNYGISTIMAAQQFLPDEAWGLAALSYVDTANATPNSLSGEESPLYLITGRKPHLPTMFKYSFGQPVICPRLLQDRLTTQFRCRF